MKKALLIVVAILALLGALAWIFRDFVTFGMMMVMLKPDAPYAESSVPTPPDYSKPTSWAALPTIDDPSDATPPGVSATDPTEARVDVFFVHPTTFYSPKGWNQALDDAAANHVTDQFVLHNQASAFNGCCRVYAPRYRQATMYSFMDDSGSGQRALDLAYEDVAAAFDYFLAHYSQGRPFIVAAHSQGSLHARHLIERRITGTDLVGRLVAVYAIGYSIPRDELAKAAPDVPVCTSATQTGCVVTWNAVGPNAGTFEPTDSNICVNPLTWRTDSERAPHDANRGAWPLGGVAPSDPTSTADPNTPLEPGAADAQCVDGRLLVTEIRSKSFDARPLGRDNYHLYDYSLFWTNLRDNALERVNTYVAHHSSLALAPLAPGV